MVSLSLFQEGNAVLDMLCKACIFEGILQWTDPKGGQVSAFLVSLPLPLSPPPPHPCPILQY